MASEGRLWRVARPLRQGTSAGWMRTYYDHLYELFFVAQDIDGVARAAIRHAYAAFRAPIIAVAVAEGEDWHVLPWRPPELQVQSLRIPRQTDPDGPTYEPGYIVEIPDIPAFAERFSSMRGLAEIGMHSMVAAAFGTRIHERGYLAFVSEGEQHYSDDERTLMALFAFAVGIALDRVEVATA
jgi:GAF domain-containing protein